MMQGSGSSIAVARRIVPLLAGLVIAPGAPIAAAERPNIVLILADDLGYGDCGACNPDAKIPTPHIDQLATEGQIFTDAHAAASTCTPSRYGLLTGINPVRTGVRNTLLGKGRPIIAQHEVTLATLLAEHGYSTRMVGKWHLGFEMDGSRQQRAFDFSRPLVGGPLDRGFEAFFGLHSSPGAAPLCYIRGRRVVAEPTATLSFLKKPTDTKPVTMAAAPGFSLQETSPLFCAEAEQILRQHAQSGKQAGPLFLYYASPIPHNPWVPSEAFRGSSGLGDYVDYVAQLDHVVGRLNQVLQETGLDRDTLLICTSDNGPGPGATRMMRAAGHACAGSLRGAKSDAWEGGHRVPFIVKWPGRVPAGTVSAATINFTDLFATLAEMLGVDAAREYPGIRDSHSFYPVLADPTLEHQRSAMIHGHYAVRLGDWKLVSTRRHAAVGDLQHSDFSLFNLRQDPAEQHDLSASAPERVASLFAAFAAFAAQYTPK